MLCPHCRTENRDERGACYHCEADLTPLRAAVLAAKQHFNAALEHIERGRNREAVTEIQAALELDGSLVEAWAVLGTIRAREERFAEARKAWEKALSLDPRYEKCHNYLQKADPLERDFALIKNLQRMAIACITTSIMLLAALVIALLPDGAQGILKEFFLGPSGGMGRIVVILLLIPVLIGLIIRIYTSLPAIAVWLSRKFPEKS
jgi:tetratricopeptide (TPR) repeat protein